MVNGVTSNGINGMGEALSIFLEIIPIIPRGSHTHARKPHNLVYFLLRHRRLFDSDAPGVTLGIYTANTDLAADLNHVIRNAGMHNEICNFINAESLGNSGQIYFDIPGFTSLSFIKFQFLITHDRANSVDSFCIRNLIFMSIRPKAPKIHQRANGDIKSATTALTD